MGPNLPQPIFVFLPSVSEVTVSYVLPYKNDNCLFHPLLKSTTGV